VTIELLRDYITQNPAESVKFDRIPKTRYSEMRLPNSEFDRLRRRIAPRVNGRAMSETPLKRAKKDFSPL
jgi:hypothetical protein